MHFTYDIGIDVKHLTLYLRLRLRVTTKHRHQVFGTFASIGCTDTRNRKVDLTSYTPVPILK